MAQQAKAAASGVSDAWEKLVAEGIAYIRMAMDAEVQRIVLRDGPAFLGDPRNGPARTAAWKPRVKRLPVLSTAG